MLGQPCITIILNGIKQVNNAWSLVLDLSFWITWVSTVDATSEWTTSHLTRDTTSISNH